MIRGVDRSHHNGRHSYEGLVAKKIAFMIAKVSEGDYFLDPDFDYHYGQARANGMLFGAYHYVISRIPARLQVEQIKLGIGTRKIDFLALDCEDPAAKPAEFTAVIIEMLELLEGYFTLKLPVIIYTRAEWWNRMVLNTIYDFRKHPLWIAQYETISPDTPKGWKNWDIWQYDETSAAEFGLAGNIDLNVWNEDDPAFPYPGEEKPMMTVLWPCERSKVWVSSTWAQHLARPGYSREYAGVDLAGYEQPLRPSQSNGKVLQSMWSTLGYGNTILIEYGGKLRTRVAHLKNRAVKVGDIVQPNTYLGTMGSTGNSTGTHVHWEVWLKRNGIWQNIDPMNAVNEVKIVNDPKLLVPLGEEVIPMPEKYVVPAFPALVKVQATKTVTGYINLRSVPSVTGNVLGKVGPREVWEAYGSHTDNLGNVWYAVKKGTVVGWVAAYYGGSQWLQTV